MNTQGPSWTRSWGRPGPTPRGMWYAESWSTWTDIAPYHDDPLWLPLTEHNAPWLPSGIRKQINHLHTKPFYGMVDRELAIPIGYLELMSQEARLKDRLGVYQAAWCLPDLPHANQYGVYVPNGYTSEDQSHEVVALLTRLWQARANKDYQAADEIRAELSRTGEVQQGAKGTFWWPNKFL